MTKLEANEVQLRKKKSDNSESPYYAQLKASINQTINDVNVNGIGFVQYYRQLWIIQVLEQVVILDMKKKEKFTLLLIQAD